MIGVLFLIGVIVTVDVDDLELLGDDEEDDDCPM